MVEACPFTPLGASSPMAITRSGRRKSDWIGSEVQHRATCKFGAHDSVLRRKRFAMVGDHRPHAPESAIGKELPDNVELWQKRTPEGFHQKHVFSTRRLFELASFGCVDRQRLLYEDVLPSFNCRESIGEVLGVDGGNIDDVDLGVGHHIVPGEALRNAGLFGERFSARRIARLHAEDFLACVLFERGDKPLGDPAGSANTPAEPGHAGRIENSGPRKGLWKCHWSPLYAHNPFNAKEETSAARSNAVCLQLPRLELPCAGQAAALSSPASCAIALRAFRPMFW
jgi:hypothetical protein